MLQKVLTDFGADESFARAAQKTKEHYGIIVAVSTTRLDVKKHAQKMYTMQQDKCSVLPLKTATEIIGQIDGSMIPIVTQKEIIESSTDKRKNKLYEWKEARLSLARAKGTVKSFYAATIGSTDEAGN